MLLGIVDGQLFMEQTRLNERAAFSEITNIMSKLNIAQRDKYGNLVHEDFYKVIQAEAFHKYCGEPLPKWFNREKRKLNQFLNNRNSSKSINPHYNYEEFTWETDEDASEDASDL